MRSPKVAKGKREKSEATSSRGEWGFLGWDKKEKKRGIT